MTRKRRAQLALLQRLVIKIGLSLRHLTVLLANLVGPRTAVIALGIWWLYSGAAAIYRPAGPIVAGGVLLWITLRPASPAVKLDRVAEAVLGALDRVGRT